MVRPQSLSKRWAERVAAEVYELRAGVDLEAFGLSPWERTIADRLREPQSLLELCRSAPIDPEAIRRLLRRLRAAGALRSLPARARSISGTVEVAEPTPPEPDTVRPPPVRVGAYSVKHPAHARDDARVIRASRAVSRPRKSEPATRRRHEPKSGLVRRFLDSVRFKR